MINILYLTILLVIGFFLAKQILRNRRRAALWNAPFSEYWEILVKQNIPVYHLLPDELKAQLLSHINIFLDEKRFEGCEGLEITDEIRVTIAAQACMLLLNRKPNYYPKLTSILVYPSNYIAKRIERKGGIETVKEQARSGESWLHGTLVFSWDAVKHGASDIKDGHNVVFHEFAHRLDQEDGRADGAPILEHRTKYASWARVLSDEYEKLQKKARKRKRSVLRKYGATNPAEFFAVLTEAFFEKPKQLKKKHPDLYEEIKDFYKVDPEEWYSNSR